MAEQLEFFSLHNPCRGVCQSDACGNSRGHRARRNNLPCFNRCDAESER